MSDLEAMIADAIHAHQPGETIAAVWDGEDVAVVTLSERGARKHGYAKVPAGERETAMAALGNIRHGGMYGGHDFAWIFDGEGGGVWSKSARLATATKDALELASGRIPRNVVAAVVTAISDDYVERSVLVELPDGTTRVVASERDTIAELDPTYGRNELLASDARWMRSLGADLARWLGVPFRDEVFS
jgi:hypothetical protein